MSKEGSFSWVFLVCTKKYACGLFRICSCFFCIFVPFPPRAMAFLFSSLPFFSVHSNMYHLLSSLVLLTLLCPIKLSFKGLCGLTFLHYLIASCI
jgi:hypothetical protein